MADTTSVGARRRRNGKAASCEPCRIGKIRCDHRQPVCGRCQQRGRQFQCTYHPAPLTRKSGLDASSGSVDSYAVPSPVSPPGRPTRHPRQTLASNASTLSWTNSHHPERGVNEFISETPAEYRAASRSRRFGANCETNHSERITCITEVLGHLRDFDSIRDLVVSYYTVSQAPVISSSLVLSALPSLSETIAASNLFNNAADDNAQLLRLAEAVLCSTSTRINITTSLSPSDFIGLYTGRNLRLEYLGIVFSIAARSCLLGLGKDEMQRDTFIRDKFNCSTTCLQLARESTPVNDMLVWLGHDYVALISCIEGDSSECTWRRLGDLYSDILALGIHRESFNVANAPFFLSEYRRKAFAKAYYTDKFMASLFDRPPRLLKRHSDCKLPLDLTDDEVLAGLGQLAEAREKLTPNGWNTEGKFCASTWARVRCIMAEIREEIFEYKFRPLTTENVMKLRNISERNRKMWESIPSHLQYTPQCWTSKLHSQICFMLTVVSLGFLQSDFEIYQMLERIDPQSTLQLLKVSAEMVSLILELGSFRRRAVYMHQRFSYVLICYGLPAAVVLAKAAQNFASNESSLPSEISRSTLIRSLSVFVSHLESISGPGETYYEICTQASKAISRTLDEILDPSPATFSPAPTTAGPSIDLDDISLGVVNFDAMNADSWNGFDLSTCVSSADWSNTYSEWTIS